MVKTLVWIRVNFLQDNFWYVLCCKSLWFAWISPLSFFWFSKHLYKRKRSRNELTIDFESYVKDNFEEIKDSIYINLLFVDQVRKHIPYKKFHMFYTYNRLSDIRKMGDCSRRKKQDKPGCYIYLLILFWYHGFWVFYTFIEVELLFFVRVCGFLSITCQFLSVYKRRITHMLLKHGNKTSRRWKATFCCNLGNWQRGFL